MGDALGEVDVARLEVDVEGDEEGSGADGDGAGAGVHACGAEVGLTAEMRDVGLEALVLGLADIRQDDPLRARGGLGVEVDGQVEALRDVGAEATGELDALVHRRLAERHEGDDVDGADARVLALVLLHVDLRDGDLDGTLHRHGDRLGLAGEGQHAAIVVDVRRPIEEVDVRCRGHDSRQGIDDLGAPALAEVGDALDQLCHRASVGAGLAPGDAVRVDRRQMPGQAAGCTSTGFGAAGWTGRR